MPDQDSAITRALDAFQALLKSKHTVNPTASRQLIAAARAELLQIKAPGTDGQLEVPRRLAAIDRFSDR